MKFKGQKILVVEDNYISYKLVEAYMIRVDLEPVYARDGMEALDLYDSEKGIQAVVMDIQLPKLNGLQVAEVIREKNKEIPIIACSANVFTEDREACTRAGCNHFMGKPIDFPELFKILSEHLH